MYIEFNNTLHNIKDILSVSKPLGKNSSDEYTINIYYGLEENISKETFTIQAEALARYEELKQILTTKN